MWRYRVRLVNAALVLFLFFFAGSFCCLAFEVTKFPATTSSRRIQSINGRRRVSFQDRFGRKEKGRGPLRSSPGEDNHLPNNEEEEGTALSLLKGCVNAWKKASICALLLFQLGFASTANAMTVRQYWNSMEGGGGSSPVEERRKANLVLVDYVMGTVNAMYYDPTGGATFTSREFSCHWRNWLNQHTLEVLDTREGALQALQYIIQQLNDPYSKYLTREELLRELHTTNDGFLGLGAMVEAPQTNSFFGALRTTVLSEIPSSIRATTFAKQHVLLSANSVSSLPVVTAVAPNSPAERAGLTVGDRILAVQKDSFWGMTVPQIKTRLDQRYHADQYFGTAELTLAKPVYAANFLEDGKSVIVAYRPQRLKLGAAATSTPPEKTGILQYQLLTRHNQGPQTDDRTSTSTTSMIMMPEEDVVNKVGYIRLTRFSKASTAAFVQAVRELEAQDAQAYILDLRNCYGGVIQESMLTAAALLRDPHAVLCYTLNSRGGFTPHQVQEYVVDARYPGYLLSEEPKDVTQRIVQQKGIPWEPPSSYASLAEQCKKLQIPYLRYASSLSSSSSLGTPAHQHQQYHILAAQKPIVLLVNEGTASSAEVFASALHDNGRIVAVVGSRTFGKGLLQHTFPLPDGGGLRLTVAEYLTPSLHHVTHVGGAQYDPRTGEFVGGGIVPDVLCESMHGIPANVGGDLCVGVGLNVLTEAQWEMDTHQHLVRTGGLDVYGLLPQ